MVWTDGPVEARNHVISLEQNGLVTCIMLIQDKVTVPVIDYWHSDLHYLVSTCQYELSHLCRKVTSGSPRISSQTPSHMPAQKCTNRTTIDGLSQKIQTTKQKRKREAQPSPPVLRSRDYITSYFAPAGDTEGSLRFRRTRKK